MKKKTLTRSSAQAMATAVIAVVSVLTLAACAGRPASSPVGTVFTPSSNSYHLGTRDKVKLIVFGEDNLSGEFEIAENGNIALPLVGEFKARGLSVAQLKDDITAKLSDGYVNNPRVSLEVVNYRPYYILGEVNKPGEYPYTANLTVLNAAAAAAGFTYRANQSEVYIRHENDVAERAYPLTTSIQVMPGDTIRVTERFF